MPQCPDHKIELVRETGVPVRGGTILVCPTPGCPRSQMPERKRQPAGSLKLPGLDAGRQERKVIIREEPAQQAIVAELRRRGYTVLVTSRQHKRAHCDPAAGGCGRWFWTHASDGADRGVPDLLITHRWWPPFTFLGVEDKGTDTPLSKEQRALAEANRILILRAECSIEQTVADAVAAVQAFEETFRGR